MDNSVYNTVLSFSDEFREGLRELTEGDLSWKFQNFPVYAPRQSITQFLIRNELFREVLHVQGSVVECGVFGGAGLFSWLQLSSIYEPLNKQRKIIGFDTFSGFSDIAEQDKPDSTELMHPGALAVDTEEELRKAGELHRSNMLVKWEDKLRLIKGDACKTIPKYIEEHPETVISLLYLDFDVYKPTKSALDNFLSRMPKGAVIAFDELNDPSWPGETAALYDSLDINSLELKRFSFDTKVCYAVL